MISQEEAQEILDKLSFHELSLLVRLGDGDTADLQNPMFIPVRETLIKKGLLTKSVTTPLPGHKGNKVYRPSPHGMMVLKAHYAMRPPKLPTFNLSPV